MTLTKMVENLTLNGYDYSDFPIPNDRIDGRVVVASVNYDEDNQIALVLLLNSSAPFFTVAHYYMQDVPAADAIPFRPRGYVHVLGDHFNIVPAVEEYQQNGGDY